jgi:16S rRNA (adenine1518-N6/adenine1519-N6)-dimethyltransferase
MYPQPRIPAELLGSFFQIIKAGFSQKRKTLRNSLSAGLRLSSASTVNWLEGAGIDPMRRPEMLSIEEWSALSALYKPSPS